MSHLSEIASIFSGYHFRGRIEASPEGDLPVLQIKDVSAENSIDRSQLEKLPEPEKPIPQVSQPGDLILLARGPKNTVIVISESDAGIVIPSSFIFIRPNPKVISPAYLAWYFIQPPAREYLAKVRTGSTAVQVILPRSLEEMPVLLPPLTKQVAIGALYELALAEQKLHRQLEEARQKQLNHHLREVLSYWTQKESDK